ncbi:hypothetical protein J14TS2_44890 [Bacillus sp. J14TS2]|uniref:hypothetical protein n=1 Tax=Bacillus sp. J14TS2 TaxID=2807188 RepID=UPI001B14CB29|nr:hypothetical protein [Bacillus sp. J14TS2]GIN74014.1 hypothetical protein J14TS2_44890 [Bacillus sp. J14TS2]
MNINKMVELSKAIDNGFPNSKIKKWVSEENLEDIELDTEHGYVKIEFYPKEDSE